MFEAPEAFQVIWAHTMDLKIRPDFLLSLSSCHQNRNPGTVVGMSRLSIKIK